ncbi:uncharacterized protein LOC124818426 [Hydra vulgaris]|uniref:uncharacterized protein LOC124818426 n=1 Tax=Hydra vulgaris TaxID=6087 RepID=UPI001F5F1330|nr:uncharacterized protein LOC124818426 [Hydra vulgaris]XP_047145295.1 uncharacterized protein LOC124818426 [Hydra vulgaris]XP_047145296.1 uncharacterized protein LOC124818426 [Hydra vulgaris]XP_047145297.1 uncharacterized protein LOC124818426 [Hydra vulgaris]XP_047145298.1 uncharacterized protein LOC124818426 [Hydra vulgaris]XP_047145299.1 uncharacterized protein LOC124818426 [Hydra vulgaris]XP_047145300.1 uncharacterized protein LOC124818426 [Hydra vulgaris]XP_047145301.1 uncharacterized p
MHRTLFSFAIFTNITIIMATCVEFMKNSEKKLEKSINTFNESFYTQMHYVNMLDIKKRNVQSTSNESNEWNEKVEYFKSLLTTIIKTTATLAGVGDFVSVLSDWIEHFTKNENVWTAIKEQVRFEIENKISSKHYFDLQVYWDEYTTIARQNNITKEIFYSRVLNKKKLFFPQTYWDLFEFSPIMISSAIVSYVTYFTAFYYQLKKEKQITDDNFQLLHDIRDEVIQAAKTMHRKRYQNLYGKDSYPYFFNRIMESSTLTFEDPYGGKVYTSKLYYVKEKIFDVIMSNTSKIIMKYLVNEVNKFFNKTLCGKLCPQLITENDIQFHYERSCYGKPTSKCCLPCFNYNRSFINDWCPTEKGVKNNRIWTKDKFENYVSCERNDWSKNNKDCMPLKQVNGVPRFKKFRKNKIKRTH